MAGNLSFTELLATVAASAVTSFASPCDTHGALGGEISQPLPPTEVDEAEEIHEEHSFPENRNTLDFSDMDGSDLSTGAVDSDCGYTSRDEHSSGTSSSPDDEDEMNHMLSQEEGDVCDLPNSAADAEEFLMTAFCSGNQELDGSGCKPSPITEATEDHPLSSYKQRKRHHRGVELPTCRQRRPMGAVEIAMRDSSFRKTDHIFQPTQGLTFDSAAEAYDFYNLYSWELGFGIRYGKSSTNRGNNYRTMQEIECSNAGFDKRCQNQSQRCGCRAMMRLLRTEDHGWYVSLLRGEHNHPLSDCCGEKMQWKSHRVIDQQTRDMIKYLRENNVPLSKVHGILGSMFGSIGDLPFTKRSLRTICAQIAREQMDDDVKKTLEIFRKMRIDDPQFAFSVDVDEYNSIKTLIWTNHRSRMQYACFGEVFTFVTTYCTNIYKMPFGLFVGVNNHFQSVIFGGVLMRDEKVESFNWVFNEFLSLMGGKPPITVLTDQCDAVGVALRETMPETTHLWCKWHVLRKAQESLGPVYSKKSVFRQQFYKVLNEMLTVDEFERAWQDLIEHYHLRHNPFMIRTYEARHMWAKPYSKDKFCARMMSTQRGESANHMLKTHVPRKSSMNQFVAQYNILLFDRAVEEDREEHNTKQMRKRSRKMWPIQLHASKVYTRAAYKLFSDELDKGSHYMVVQREQNEIYEVHHSWPERRECWARVIFKVAIIDNGISYDCECGLYTHFGILCCHAIRVMIYLGVSCIPAAHILKRWTKEARDVLPAHLSLYQKDSRSMQSQTYRHGMLYMNALEGVKIGNTDVETFQIMMKHISAGKKEVEVLVASRGVSDDDVVETHYESSDAEWQREPAAGYQSEPEMGFKENTQYGASGCSVSLTHTQLLKMRAPLVVRSNGRPKVNRFRSPVESGVNKRKKSSGVARSKIKSSVHQTSFCRICRCSGHNSTTCPDNPNAGKKVKKVSHCSICQLPGHKSSNCRSKTPEEFELEQS